MKVLLVIVLIIVFVLLTRVSFVLSYGHSGASVVLRVYFLKVRIYPGKGGQKKEKDKSKKKPEEREEAVDDRQGGKLDKFKEIFGIVKAVILKLSKNLVIKKLTIWYTVSNDDAAKAAMYYGSASTAVNSLISVLGGYFKIKERDIRIGVDFSGSGSKIYAEGVISVAIWEIIYIAVPILVEMTSEKRNKKERRDIDGQTSYR